MDHMFCAHFSDHDSWRYGSGTAAAWPEVVREPPKSMTSVESHSLTDLDVRNHIHHLAPWYIPTATSHGLIGSMHPVDQSACGFFNPMQIETCASDFEGIQSQSSPLGLDEKNQPYLDSHSNEVSTDEPAQSETDSDSLEKISGVAAFHDLLDERSASSGQEGIHIRDKFASQEMSNPTKGLLPEKITNVGTLMIHNIPSRCNRQEILDAIDAEGFAGTYNFFYLPIRRSQNQNYGYAFISFKDSSTSTLFGEKMNGFSLKTRKSTKTLYIKPARIQGIQEHVEHFKDKIVMSSKCAPLFMDVENAELLGKLWSPVAAKNHPQPESETLAFPDPIKDVSASATEISSIPETFVPPYHGQSQHDSPSQVQQKLNDYLDNNTYQAPIICQHCGKPAIGPKLVEQIDEVMNSVVEEDVEPQFHVVATFSL